MKTLILIGSFLLASTSFALNISAEVEQEYLQKGGDVKALSHLKCFLHNYSDQNFSIKRARMAERCNGMSQSSRQVQMNSFDHIVIVDYNKRSSERRLYLLDLENPQPPYVETYYVAHGKYRASSYRNQTPAVNQNTIQDVDYFSNVSGSNASSTGFFITGHTYQGRWRGPAGDKFSLIVHGISKDLNDNACDRAIVVHGHSMVKESGPQEGVDIMSAGCFMLDLDVINTVIAKIRGGGGDHHPSELRLGGTLIFTHGRGEALLPSDYYCRSESQNSLRL